ncbi:MAG: GDYXXLXY domain-containing protein [Myxococcota bacterium]
MKRHHWIWLFGVLVLLLFNGLIIQKEREAARSETMYFELAPVDPRSLIQGDYMTLRYEVANQIRDEVGAENRELDSSDREGRLVVRLDERRVAHFDRIYDGDELAAEERVVQWDYRGGIYIGADSYMFQEGKASLYEQAEYAEMQVTDDGGASLVALRDGQLERIE